jgi:hypothetical protein
MTNPAKALYDILAAWKQSYTTSNDEARQLGSQGGWEQQLRAIELLKDINELIITAESNGEDVSAAKETFPKWRNMVFAYPDGWSANSYDTINDTDMLFLNMFQGTVSKYVPEFTDNGKESLENFLDLVMERLEDAEPFLKNYAFKVISHIRGVLEEWEYCAEFRIGGAMKDLKDLIDYLAEQQPDNHFWQKAKNGFSGFFKQGVITAVTTALLITPASEGSKAIMSGGKELISEIRTQVQVEQKQLPAADIDASVESPEETSEPQ